MRLVYRKHPAIGIPMRDEQWGHIGDYDIEMLQLIYCPTLREFIVAAELAARGNQ